MMFRLLKNAFSSQKIESRQFYSCSLPSTMQNTTPGFYHHPSGWAKLAIPPKQHFFEYHWLKGGEIYIYIYLKNVLEQTKQDITIFFEKKMIYIYLCMQSWKQCALPVITTMALWQLMHLGTWYTVTCIYTYIYVYIYM